MRVYRYSPMTDKQIAKRETRFAWHLPKTDYRDDYHYVKELVTYTDGSTEPRTYFIKNYERLTWVTASSYRNHKDKKEYEDKDKLISRKTTESDLARTTAGLLGKIHLANNVNAIKEEPYVYGYDIPSTSFIKYTSLKKNNFVQSAYSVAVLDIETDPRTNLPIMITITYKGKAHCSVIKSFLNRVNDPYRKVKEAIGNYLPKYKDIDYTLDICDDIVEGLKTAFKVANKWAPDFLAVWNVDFDMTRILETLKARNINPIDVICDQSVPRNLRVCRYKRGMTKKVTASGVVKPVNPSLQWHTLICTSTFYVIDAMCVYRQLRMAKAEEPSYSLDAILNKELGSRKLKFEQADKYQGLEWHLFMQANYPVEYIVYNLYDCLGVEELDLKTKDLSNSMPSFAGITDFMKFNSQARKLTDALFLFGIEKGRVIGTAAPPASEDINEELIDVDEDDEDDDEEGEVLDPSKFKTLPLKGWIQLLPQNRLIPNGLKCLSDFPEVRTAFRGITCDFDAKSSYPSCTQAANVSKETCVNEVITISGLDEDHFRELNLSVCLGNANMLEFFEKMFLLPSLELVDDLIERGEI